MFCKHMWKVLENKNVLAKYLGTAAVISADSKKEGQQNFAPETRACSQLWI